MQVTASTMPGNRAPLGLSSTHVRPLFSPNTLSMLACTLCLLSRATQTAAADPRFTITTLAEGFHEPTALHHAPDGRLFVGQRGGAIHTVNPATGQSTLWAQLEVVTDGESGLLGLTVHPDFPGEPYVYVFATVSTSEQHIIRLRDQNGVGTEATVIRDGIPTRAFIHNGGCVRVGPDRMLYFSVGDTGLTASSQSLTSLAGKICRVRLDGSVPEDNPFVTPTGAPRSVYALGLRNPFRFCFAPDGRLFVMDVGSNDAPRREEINLVAAGDNLGWPLFEGSHPDAAAAGYVQPIYEYVDKGSSIAGCVYYDGGQFPEEFQGNLFHLDYTSHGLFRVILDGDRVVDHLLLVRGEGGPVDLALMLDGSLAYCELFSGRIRQVRYIGGPVSFVPDPVPPEPAPCAPGLPAVLPLILLLMPGRRSGT